MNLENKENLSNYQLLKRKPSLCSTSLPFNKLITVVQFFIPVTPILQWFHLNFGAGNFRGRRPGTSALRMLRRLTAVLVANDLSQRVGATATSNVKAVFFRLLLAQKRDKRGSARRVGEGLFLKRAV